MAKVSASNKKTVAPLQYYNDERKLILTKICELRKRLCGWVKQVTSIPVACQVM